MMITDPNPGVHMRIVPMEDVVNGRTIDGARLKMRAEDIRVRHVFEYKAYDPGFDALVESIETWGLEAGFEPCWDEYAQTMRDGHHRACALWLMGAKWCPVNEDKFSFSDWFRAPDGSRPARDTHTYDK